MSIVLNKTGEGCRLTLEGATDVSCACELKTALIDALACGSVEVSLETATYLDVTAFQLLWAAAEEARRSGCALKLVGAAPESVLTSLTDAGFQSFLTHLQAA